MSSSESREPLYDFEIERIVNEIREGGYKRVLIQLPDGLKIYSKHIFDEIKRRVDNVEIAFSGDSAWGSCVLADLEAERYGYELLVHIGHVEYPYYKPRHRTLFIPAHSKLDVSEDLVDRAIELLEKYNAKRVGVFTTVQHEKILPKIVSILSRKYEIIATRTSVVLGCEYSSPLAIKNRVDAYVIVSGGIFHGIGLGLAAFGKPVIKIDPYESRVVDLSGEVERVYRVRVYKMYQAAEARNWVLIDGVRGQNRSWYRKYLEELIRRKGGEYLVYISEVINIDLLRNIDSGWVDSFVVLACPRLPIDDLWEYPKPVLTPAEARMVLSGRIGYYTFPW